MTVWYAQNATTNIDAAGQWNDAPGGGGNVLTWANLDPADVLCANGKNPIYVNGSFTCAAITTAGGGIGADGGKFLVQTGARTYTLTCNVVAGTTTCLQIDHSSGTITVIGDVTAGGTANASGIHKFTGAGALAITGAITGGGTTNARGLLVEAGGSTTLVTGSATGGTGAVSHGILLVAAATVTLNGTATGGTYVNTQYMAAGICNNHASGVLTVNGTVSAGTGPSAPGAWGALGPVTVIGSLVDTATCSAAYGAIYWRPASMAHYHQTPWNGSYNFRYTVPPMAQNVRDGVQRGYMLEFPDNGTLQIPAEADVKLGVGYGGGGTEYEGELVAGGGGVPLIGPGGLVG